MLLTNNERQELKEILTNEVKIITFKKDDGTTRVMKCTLQPNVLPKQILTEEHKTRKENKDVLSVWDLDLNEWRAFRFDRVLEIE